MRISILPKTLFNRFFLIISIPMILLVLIMGYIFLNRHWDNVSKHMQKSVVDEVRLLRKISSEDSFQHTKEVARILGINLLNRNGVQHWRSKNNLLEQEYIRSTEALKAELGQNVEVLAQKPYLIVTDDLVSSSHYIIFPLKRVVTPTTYIFLFWLLATTFILMFISLVFMRNQVRSIRQLSNAADQLGKGQPLNDFQPTGAKEIRTAGESLINMHNRLQRLVNYRTQLLAQISHDIRTPLTRFKLQLSMLNEKQAAASMEEDVNEMEELIISYLNFAKAEGNEEVSSINLQNFIETIISKYNDPRLKLNLHNIKAQPDITLRKKSFKRCLCNLIENAQKFASKCIMITLHSSPEDFIITIEDDGQGIPEGKYEEAVQPFIRLDTKNKGYGLGLAIAQSVVHAHGGSFQLAKSEMGGLKIIITIPI
jgi:two-component system osmolarity sensor histidine kinase EnvZ